MQLRSRALPVQRRSPSLSPPPITPWWVRIFAGGAYLSKDPVKIGNLAAQDWGKLASMAIIIIGSLMATFGSSAMIDWLKM